MERLGTFKGIVVLEDEVVDTLVEVEDMVDIEKDNHRILGTIEDEEIIQAKTEEQIFFI